MKNTLVYRHLKLSNNEVFYIGIGDNRRPYSKSSRNDFWKNIVKKDGYKVEVLITGLSRVDANKVEIGLIEYYGRRDLKLGNLTNMTKGGDGISKGHKHNKSFRDKARRRQLGITPSNKGIPISEETRLKISNSLKGNVPWNKGIPPTEQHRKNVIANVLRGIDNPASIRVCVKGVWYNTMKDAGIAISNRTTVLNRCKSPNWNYFREGLNDPTPI
jgi:hypothetical protein